MSLISFAKVVKSKAPNGDWSQQELAEIYRVLHLLQKAGVAIDLDRSITDIGEPWCVFFDPQGDSVFLHIARLGGQYVLVSDALDLKVRAGNFRQATAAFEDKVSGTLRKTSDKAGKVVAHPSAQLLFSLTAIFLLVKSKSAHAEAHEAASALASDIAANLKMRALSQRLSETIDNPVLVAAMVTAIALTAASPGNFNEGLLTGELGEVLPGTDAHHESTVAQINELSTGAQIVAADVVAHDMDGLSAKTDSDSARKSAVAQPEMVVDLVLVAPIDDALIQTYQQELVAGSEIAATQRAAPAQETELDAMLLNDAGEPEAKFGSASVNVESAWELNGGPLSQQDLGTMVDPLVVTTLSMSADYDDVVLLVSESVDLVSTGLDNETSAFGTDIGNVTSVGTVPELEPSGSVSDVAMTSTVPTINAFVMDMLMGLVDVFGEVDVFTYGGNTMIIVDTEVQDHNGGDLGFVSGELFDGFTVSLIGNRSEIDEYFLT